MVTRQPLLWERLLPSPTNPLGILLGLLLAAGPLLFLVLVWSLPRCSGQDLWQKLALIVTLILFLAVGLVASVKIGGGNNLHNLDMFLVGLLIVAGIAWESGADRWLVKRKGSSPWMVLPFVLLVLYPTSQIFTGTYPHNVPDPIVVAEALDSIRAKVGAAQQCGEVLFIDNRQLLTFKYLTGVRLVPEYEKKLMMDYAMANNAAYFQPFYRDLARRRFAMIVTEPLRTDYQGGSFEFGNENDAWVKWVSLPVLQSYTPYETLEQVGVQLLVPKDNPCTALPR